MTTRFVFKKTKLTENEKEMVQKKLSKLDKFFSDDTEAAVNFAQLKNERKKVEVTILFKDTFYRSEVDDADFISAIEKAVDVLEGQIRKNKTRLKKRLRDGAFDKYSSPEPEITPTVVKTKRFNVGNMDACEAITEMELLMHKFFIFKNSENDKLSVVYKRNDGEYGIIIPE